VRDGATLAAGTALGVPAAALAQQAVAADVVLRGGRVLTMRGNRVAEAVAVTGGRVAYVGSDSGAGAQVGAAAEVIDLRGRTLMPGIHDGHTHPLAGGLSLTKPTLNYRKLDLKEFVAAIRQEKLTGQIRPGYAADLIVLDRDLLRVALERVSKANVALTMVGGRIVHRA
jgi:predicted amidohydrolase YtcJ